MKTTNARIFKVIAFFICFLLVFEQSGFAQVATQLDIAGHLDAMRNALTVDRFRPLHLRYLQYLPEQNNFRLLLDKGKLNPSTKELESTSKDLLKYFLIGLSLPNDSFWVNLRPDSPDNVIDPLLAQTDVGKIFLEADLQLKKDTARFTSPDTPEGKEYWDKLYKKAGELFGYENITIPTLTRPWIVPDEIIVRETADSAYIYKATLKVMLEQDYLKDSATYNFADPRLKELNEYSSQLIRELIIPQLTVEVNSAKRYASLRQVYYSLIMAQWFKARYADRNTAYSRLINRKDITKLVSKAPWSTAAYFEQYQKSFKDGEYNIKEPVYTPFGQVMRSYFSGGIDISGDLGFQVALANGLSADAKKVVISSPVPPPVNNNVRGITLDGEGNPVPQARSRGGAEGREVLPGTTFIPGGDNDEKAIVSLRQWYQYTGTVGRMQPHSYSSEGFLASGEDLVDVLLEDKKAVDALGVTFGAMADWLEEALRGRENGEAVVNGQRLRVKWVGTRGFQSPPLPGVRNSSGMYWITNIKTNETVGMVTEMHPDLIRLYGFFEGHTAFR
ncbi:MAG: hypothetical protein Q8O22_01315, partial [Candidatus Omnitrophota bacterium]|nr:hypothetical protein [Candidatus Omnitrophota bacterium]